MLSTPQCMVILLIIVTQVSDATGISALDDAVGQMCGVEVGVQQGGASPAVPCAPSFIIIGAQKSGGVPPMLTVVLWGWGGA